MKKAVFTVMLIGLLAATSCGSDDRVTVFVSAAASLTDSFEAMEVAFEAQYPDVDVILNLAGSSTLREQILAGAPADVFASANEEVMEDVAAAGLLSERAEVFAGNLLEIAVPPANPAAISGLADFGREDLVLGLCAAGVPCGDFAREALSRAAVDPAIDTFEPNVRALLTKIELGDLDGGIVYVTDVLAADGNVVGIPIPTDLNVAARYPIAVLRDSRRPEAAANFVGFVLSAAGREILADHGFGTS